ncbi:RnfABCDGE type electron transport complex subunit D [Candidatus Bipolaricaulota bacterium]|nr:RnfABCDGE type electron transport complex subunit D [Candidatus Bipolaricaulota bacterium]
MNRLERLLSEISRYTAEHPYLKHITEVIDTTRSILFEPGISVEESPFLRDYIEIKRYMFAVVLAVAPAALASIYFYGWRALAMIVVSYVAGGLAEVTFTLIRKEEITEGFLVTGILFPLTLPPNTPLWMVAVGIIVGVIIGKEVFGGTGYNIFNPALVGRVFLTTTFPVATSSEWLIPMTGGWAGFKQFSVDTVTSATPLGIFANSGTLAPLKDLFFGNIPGCLGESSALLILAGGIFMALARIIDWRVPVAYLGSVFLYSALGTYLWPNQVAPPVFQLLAGGLLFGAIYMATDPVSSPTTKEAKWVYGVFLGVMTVSIRAFSGYPEGVTYSILLMNMFAPLIDELVMTFRYGPIQKPYK